MRMVITPLPCRAKRKLYKAGKCLTACQPDPAQAGGQFTLTGLFNSMNLTRFLLFVIILPLLSFADKEPNYKEFRISGFAQGTSYSLLYYASDTLITRAQTDSIFVKIDSSLSVYKPYSLVSRFNRSRSGLQLDGMLGAVVRKSIDVSKKTEGAFDLTVQPLVQAWGFSAARIRHLPDSQQIDSLLNCVGMDHIRLKKNRLIKDKPCVEIDVNGIAQGYSVDLLAAFLESKGIRNYLVELGGEIRVKGRKQPSGERMTVGIESPGDDSDGVLPITRTIRLDEGAITTSGNYRKFYQNGLKRISHLINPKTGYPIENEMISVTVVAEDAMTADAYDNALMNMGLKNAMRVVSKQKNLHAYFIYHKPDGSVADTASPGFYRMIR